MRKNTPTEPAKITLKNIKKFFQGWTRWIVLKLSKNKFVKKVSDSIGLLPGYKQEQFLFRLQTMNQECLKSGNCVVCGCETPQLQLADDACDGKCYPVMMNKEDWEKYKKEENIVV